MTDSALNPELAIYLQKMFRECKDRTSVSCYSHSNLLIQLQASPPAPLMSSDLQYSVFLPLNLGRAVWSRGALPKIEHRENPLHMCSWSLSDSHTAGGVMAEWGISVHAPNVGVVCETGAVVGLLRGLGSGLEDRIFQCDPFLMHCWHLTFTIDCLCKLKGSRKILISIFFPLAVL